ncbi:MAG: ParB/RepB/Spo0J family partition protein [bacterium]
MQKTTGGLGRGLGSLIPSKRINLDLDDGVASPISAILTGNEQVIEISVDRITPNPHQPRSHWDENDLNELAASIKEHGVIQPIIVTKFEDGYQLIAGERRWRASKLVGLRTIPSIVRDFSEQKKMEIALIENLQRKDLNAMETALAYRKLLDEFNITQEELSKRLGKSRPAITNTIRILNTTQEVQQAIWDEKISEGHARMLAALPFEDQDILLKKILSNNMNVRETERATKEVVIKKNIRKVNYDPETRAKEDILQQTLNTKVEIKKFGGQGQIIIRFFSEEELDNILSRIG